MRSMSLFFCFIMVLVGCVLAPVRTAEAALATPKIMKVSSPAKEDTKKGDSGTNRADDTTKRFPQPVLVGVLRGRLLIEPEESQHVLGRVVGVVRGEDGAELVVEAGGPFQTWFGIGTHPVVVPIDSVSLLGEHVALTDLDADEFQKLPEYKLGSKPAFAANVRLQVGIVRPFH